MKFRRKTKHCLNCDRTLDEIYNYCPNCGQENNDNNVSFGTFIHDFFANYFSFDSKIGRSVLPFFFKPGFLTNRFNAGKRVSYVHPLRLYLIISVFFFFAASLLVKQALENASLNDPIILDTTPTDSVNSLQAISSTQQFMQVMRDESLSDHEAMDSLKNMDIINIDTTSFNKMIFRQGRKVLKNDLNVFGAYIVQNLPIMMFLLLPLFALLLKLFYIRRGILYVQHLVHALHLHAFIFILFGTLIICYLVFQIPPPLGAWLNWITFLLFISYTFFSFLRVYRQGWIKTAVKVFLLGSIYFVVLLFFGFSEAFISFLIF